MRSDSLSMLSGLWFSHVLGCLASVLLLFSAVTKLSLGNWLNIEQQTANALAAILLVLLPGRYRLGGICKVAVIALDFFPQILYKLILPSFGMAVNQQTIIFMMTAVSLISAVLSFAALIFEYTAHASNFPLEKKKWIIFLACTLTVNLFSYVFTYLIPTSALQNLSESFIWIWNIFTKTLVLAFSVAYLILLRRGIRILKTSQKQQENDIW